MADQTAAAGVTISAPRPRGSCSIFASGPPAPCTIVIFGASGDLTGRKLIPALYDLFRNNGLPSPFAIVGAARSDLDHDSFRSMLRAAFAGTGRAAPDEWEAFAANLFYHRVVYDSAPSHAAFADFLRDLDRERGTRGNRLFYLAVPPTLYPVIADRLGAAGLARERSEGNGWARIVVEKPFGRDLETAVTLDRTLHRSFAEHQIFRIDHYLAKETVQNILMLRFANAIFEPVWNRNYIDYVGIVAAEQLGVEHRAGYYEQAGVLRDMFQNHMQQLLALTALEPPSHFEANQVRDEKVKVFRALKPFDLDTINDNLVLGQYTAGSIEGRPVPGYRDEPGVAADSSTPTLAMMRVFVDNWRWRHVPFYMVSGKRLAEKITRIVIQFKNVPHSMFRNVLGEHIGANRLTLGIHPEEEITLTFQTKTPGARLCLRPVTMDFRYYDNVDAPPLDAYAKVLLDCIGGDQTLFWRQDGVEACWSFLTPILEECESCGGPLIRRHPYEAGSRGPEAGRQWMKMLLGG